jgi:small-conductance mechanosensitive channel
MDWTMPAPEIFRPINEWTLLHIALIVLSTALVIMITQRLLPWLAERLPGNQRPYVLATVPVLRLLAIVVAVVLITPLLVEPTVENVIALVGALSIMLGFALKDYASSLAAGIVTLYEMPYRPGDWIAINGDYGEVKRIGMRAVEIVTPADNVVTIPHLALWTQAIHNANNGSQHLMCIANFYLHPHHDGQAVRQLLYDVALTSPFLQASQPILVVAAEQPWATHYQLKAYPVNPRDQFEFITDLTLRGKTALHALGVASTPAPYAVTSSS